MDHVTYALLIFSGSFVLYLYVNLLMALWDNSGKNAPDSGTPLPSFAMFRGLTSNGNNKPEGSGYSPVPLSLTRDPGHIALHSPMTPRTGDLSRTRQTDATEEGEDEEHVELTDAYWADHSEESRR